MGLTGNLRGKRAAGKTTAASTKRPYTGKKRGRKPKQDNGAIAGVTATPAGTRTGKQNNRLVELETELDRLLYNVMTLGQLTDVENAYSRGSQTALPCVCDQSLNEPS